MSQEQMEKVGEQCIQLFKDINKNQAKIFDILANQIGKDLAGLTMNHLVGLYLTRVQQGDESLSVDNECHKFVRVESILIKFRLAQTTAKQLALYPSLLAKLRDWDIQYTKEIGAQIAQINESAVKEVYQMDL
jgi:hypothetical protein